MRFLASALNLAIILVLAGCETVSFPIAAKFPVRDQASAISIAKYVCRRKAGAEFQWEANWVAEKRIWVVDTEPSIHKSGDHLWVVDVPLDGPLPTQCWDSMYDLVTPSGTLTR